MPFRNQPPVDQFAPQIGEGGKIIDYIEGDLLENRPEERVRQRLQKLLHLQYGYPKECIAREVDIHYGGSTLSDIAGDPVLADVAVFRSSQAKRVKDQGQVEIVCETKRPRVEEGHGQLVSYIFNTSAGGGLWYNGGDLRVWRRVENQLTKWPHLPRSGEAWDAVGRQTKSDLQPLVDVRGTLRRCHDRLHRRGVTDDVTLTMVRLLLAKWRDEERPGEETDFYCTPEEFRDPQRRIRVAERIETLFEEVRDANPTVFDPHEQLGATPDEIIEVVSELQEYRLLGEDEVQWDLIGAAYEQYTGDEMKREGGEFFTNRLIVNLMSEMVQPDPDDLMLDPAGGTGGFCLAVLRAVRRMIHDKMVGRAAQARAVSQLRDRIYYIEKKSRLVKLAKTAMIMFGNGHHGFVQGASLDPVGNLPSDFIARCAPGRVTLVMTNPPWAGMTNGRQSDTNLLQQYEVARRWEWVAGRYEPGPDFLGGGVPPEYLFVERCITWLAPLGRLAIVLPKGLLDNMEPALAVRHYLFRHCRVLAVINCHKNTFQPYTGSRGCIIIAQKKEHPGDDGEYPIFMAINRKIGQDSEGEPVYKKDDEGRSTSEIDHDLEEILQAWRAHLAGELVPSEYTFSIMSSSLDGETLKLNPQFFLPSLNQTIKRIVSLDGNGFSVERLGDGHASRIWKGARFKREDLETDQIGTETVPYFTPSAVFMRGDGVKLLDLSRCQAKRKAVILAHRAVEGEILITRSGTIGRIAVVGPSLQGVLLSDDLIRVWIEDRDVRAFVLQFLKSPEGQDQLRRNEYGTVQQHLEPAHVADLLLPIPDDKESLTLLLEKVRAAEAAREKAISDDSEADTLIRRILDRAPIG